MTVKINSIAMWHDTLVQYSTEWHELHGETLRWTGLPRMSSLSEILEYMEAMDIHWFDITTGSARRALYCHLDPRYRTVVITI